MRLRDYPEIILDTIPKLYESQSKVLITHLYGIEQQVERLPKNFCKMYTTEPLARQLLIYLQSRGAAVTAQDFLIVKEGEPFKLRLSDGKRLELLLCAGNELGSSHMLLIRKLQGGRLLAYYSAVQQDDLCRLMGNVTYQQWIAEGTEHIYLNLQAAEQPFNHLDFDQLAKAIDEYNGNGATLLVVPLFGYEYLIRRLSQTYALQGHMKLSESLRQSYACLSGDLDRFQLPGYRTAVHITVKSEVLDIVDMSAEIIYPLDLLQWSPVPHRMNLIQLCSLLRPVYINGIVGYHADGHVPAVPKYLKHFRFKPPPGSGIIEEVIPETQLPNEQQPIELDLTPSKQMGATATRKEPLVISKQRKLAFVDSEDD